MSFTQPAYDKRYWTNNRARLYCSHLENGLHCKNQVLGWVQYDVIIEDRPIGKVYRYCETHETEAEQYAKIDPVWFLVAEL